MSRVLVIGDLHEPYTRKGYFKFCCDMCEKYDCNKVVFIGDVVDLHSISFHDKLPGMPGALDEYEETRLALKRWVKAFPKAKVCIGNHDARPVRLAATVGIPENLLKDFPDIWETPDWKWRWDFVIDDVFYLHGTANGGEHPSYNKMKSLGLSCVMGHIHAAAGVKWLASPVKRMFGMDTGSGVDDKRMAFAYSQFARRRSIISCGIVIDGIPHHEVCAIGPGEKYADERF